MIDPFAFVGREEEANRMRELLATPRGELLAVLGRRRVGNTALIRNVFASEIDFEITGIQRGTMKMQLAHFHEKFKALANVEPDIQPPVNWQDAFGRLKQWLQHNPSRQKRVLFFDELPWLATPRSMFLEMLGHFWNDYASMAKVLIVVCGSAAGWMVKQVVHQKGGLHNRITLQLHLKPFTLHETATLLQAKGITLNSYHIVQLYMVTGGIPHYLHPLKPGGSVAQYISQLCFEPGGVLTDEFEKLYSSLYDRSENHIAIVRALAGKWRGLTRNEIVEATGLSDGGSINRYLHELELSDFITVVWPFDKKKKEKIYRLTDFYSLFYLKFMEQRRKRSIDGFVQVQQSQAYKSWCGYAFENNCLYHLAQIKKYLGFSAVAAEASSYLFKGGINHKGFQIDLLIDRADGIIHLCEMKFYDGPFTVTAEFEERMRNLRATFREITGTRKSIYLTWMTPFGLLENAHKYSFETQVDAAALFVPLL